MGKLILSLILFFSFIPSAFAQSTKVSASVGNYYLSVSGYVSPFASIVMSSGSIFMGSAVADPKGNFSIQKVLVVKGFSDFCLEAIDVKRVGDSYTCFKIKPVLSDSEANSLFLPPTLGLSGKKIDPGSSVFASGYTMPNAKVVINISKDINIDVLSDKNGFYKYEIKAIPAGKYSLFATANYEKKDSEKPSRTKELESVSVGGLIKKNLLLVFIVVLVAIVVLILILILIAKRLKRGPRGLGKMKSTANRKQVAQQHHSWFLGY